MSSAESVGEIPVAALLASRRRERERLSRILHDDVAGGLTAAGLSLDLLALDAPRELTARIAEIQDVLERSFEAVRELSRELHPDPAVRFHFLPAMEMLTRRFAEQFAGDFRSAFSESAASQLTPDQARACYAVAEAALENILLHAQARRAWVTLETTRGAVFTLTIRDDGRGFEESTPQRGTGTAIMEYHVLLAGLELSVQSTVGRGTVVQLIPGYSVRKKKRGSHADGD